MTIKGSPKELYLELMKNTLCFLLWGNYEDPDAEDTEQGRREGRVWPRFAHTMIGLKRLENIQFCVETVLAESVPGDLIETGV